MSWEVYPSMTSDCELFICTDHLFVPFAYLPRLSDPPQPPVIAQFCHTHKYMLVEEDCTSP